MEQDGNQRKGVFISYSHDGDEHKARVRALADRLNKEGVDCTIDQYITSPPEGWPKWMEYQLDQARFVLVVCTETYKKRCGHREKKGVGRGTKWESTLTYNDLYYEDSLNERFIPIVFQTDDTQYIPRPLKGFTGYCVGNKAGYDDLYRVLTGEPGPGKPPLGEKRLLKPQVSLARLPGTGDLLVGRDRQLALLDRAWAGEETRVFTVVAFGGVGKSALVNRWLDRMGQDNYRGARRVWGWSFYSQGSAQGRQVSADLFVDTALREFGDDEPGAGTAWEKGERLARLVRAQKTLLILDGLEPLQHPSGELAGRLKDQSLQALLKELARHNPGLCVMTTRVAVEDLRGSSHEKGPVRRLSLEHLEPEAGAELLRRRGVKGKPEQLEKVSRDFGGHALALQLLGGYLVVVHSGNADKVSEVRLLDKDNPESGHARRVMESYESNLKGTPELEILYLLGFFDRPASPGAIQALLTGDPLPGVTETLSALSDAQWKYALNRLQNLGLLATHLSSPSSPSLPSLDSHPLVSEHFSRRLRDTRPKSYTTGHQRLYDYYRNRPEKKLPGTLAEMEPLFIAVKHGCAAGKYQEAFDEVYWERISRENEAYVVKKLGAFGSDLAALSSFFDALWQTPSAGLNEHRQAKVLGLSGFGLRGLGHLREAAQPMEASLELAKKLDDWKGAAMEASNLSELWLCLGDVSRATALGRESVALAYRSGDEQELFEEMTTHADALYQAGEVTEAERLFRDAEARQKKWQPRYTYLHGLQGFRYCDLLLGLGRASEVRERVEKFFKWWQPSDSLLDIALEELSAGRAHWHEASSPRDSFVQTARLYLDRAVVGLRQYGSYQHLPRGLLSRAGFMRWCGEGEAARQDLDEARDIAQRGHMKLWLADAHLEFCRLEAMEKNPKKAEEHLEEAKKIVEETGYHRRDKEIEALEGILTREPGFSGLKDYRDF